MSVVSAGIDIGGGSAKVGLADKAGKLVRAGKVRTPETDDPVDIVNAYLDPVKSWLKESRDLELVAVGVGVPGHVICDKTATDYCNIELLNRYPLARHINNSLGVPVTIENDATYAGLGEYNFGAGKTASRFLMATLGTGIGAVFIDDGVIISTSNGTMGDAGHMIIDYDMRYECKKGCMGCLESVASGLALERDARQIAMANPDSHLGNVLHKSGRDPTVRDLIAGSMSGDSLCQAKVEETVRWLAMWSATLVQLFAPDVMAFGGGWSAAGQEFIDRIYKQACHAGHPGYFRNLEYVQATLGNDAGIAGAASDAMNMVNP